MAKAFPDKPGRPVKLFDRDITKDRRVNKFKLDKAAEEQADIYGYWSDLEPKAKKEVDDLILEIEIESGKKYNLYKESLDGGVDAKGNKKLPTDTAVEKAVAADEEIIKLKKDLNEKKYYLGLIKSAINTMDSRRSSIKVLNELFHDNYWQTKNLEGDQFQSRESHKEKIKDGKQSIRDKMRDMEVPEETTEEAADVASNEEEIPPGMEDFDVNEVEYQKPIPQESVEEETDSPEPEEEDEELTETASDDAPEESEEEESDNDQDLPNESAPEEEAPEEEAPEEEAPEEGNLCPWKSKGFKFGEFGEHNECDECDMESACFRESKKRQ